MKKTIILFLTLFLFTFTSCTRNETAIQNEAKTEQNHENNSYSKPLKVNLRSEEEIQELYSALNMTQEDFSAFVKTNGNLFGLHSPEEARAFWEKFLALKIPNPSEIPNLTFYCWEFFPETGLFIFNYTAGGRQYNICYYPGPMQETEMVPNPVATGTLHGAEIKLTEIVGESPWEYEAKFHLDGYNVYLWIRNDLGVTDPMPINLNYSSGAWYEADKKGNIIFHLPESEATE